KVKLIYIDPPYNTGNDSFAYNDNFNHSTWMVFMKNRLQAAKELLSDDGCIFVQCDDNEQAYLKVLMDEIFGKENFETNITTIVKTEGRRYGNLAKTHEYILLYAKDRSLCEMYEIEIKNKKFSFEDSTAGFDLTDLRNQNTVAFNSTNRPNLRYPFYVDLESKDKDSLCKVYLEKKEGLVEVYPITINNLKSVWRWGKDKSKDNIETNLAARKGSDGIIRIFQKYRSDTTMAKTVWFETEFISNKGTKELQALFGNSIFSFPKSEALLERIIQISTLPNDLVLDFHLGSGTTAAVAHKMGRRYIGVEQMDYIETISVERLRKVIGIYQKPDNELLEKLVFDEGGISKSVNWFGGGSFVYLELARYNQTALDHILNAADYDSLVGIFEETFEEYYLHYNVKIKAFKETILSAPEFKSLSLDRQKQIAIKMLDLNQLYVNASELHDAKYALSETDKTLTENFYTKPIDQL
ncbi:MAG: site-specific DNA-methyltransferase, partial [Cellulosilyticaceae bacterium]